MATAPKRHNQSTRKRDWRAIQRQRGTAHERGYTSRWAEYSRQYRREHPLCVECERYGRTQPTEHVDHIVPVTGPDDPRFFDESNLQALCRSCHSSKTATEDNGRKAGR